MSDRPGFALVTIVLLLAVLAAAGAGMFALAAREAEVAAALARRAAAGAAADAAVRSTVAAWSTRRYRSIGIGETTRAVVGQPPPTVSTAKGIEATADVTRLSDRLFLIDGTGRSSPGPGAVARAGVLVSTLDPGAMAGAFGAAVTAEESILVQGGSIRIDDACPEEVPAATLSAPDVTILPEAQVHDADNVASGEPAPMATPDPFQPPLLPHLASVMLSAASVTPTPWTGPGGCEARESNWGSSTPAHECYELLPLVWADSDLTVRGGEGRGVLVVDGDLLLDGLRFEGVILVRGTATITGSTVLRGAVRARAVHVWGGMLTHEPCAVRDALSAGGLDRAFRASHRWWIPRF